MFYSVKSNLDRDSKVMEEDKKKKDNLKRNPKEHYKNQTEGGDDDADADSDDEAATSHDIDKPTLARVIGNCTAFMCIIFIVSWSSQFQKGN